jgi:hypothetical protein
MINNKQTYQSNLVWEPSPEINWIKRAYPVKDGINLSNSVTEDVGGFSLCPHYLKKQLRRINRVHRRKNTKFSIENPKWSSQESRSIHENKQVMLRRTFQEETGQ